MRRLLLVLVAAGLGLWLAGPALSARPFVPHAVEFAQAIPAAAGATRPSGDWRSRVITTAKRFDLVGLTWRSAQRAGARIRVRDAGSGRWSAWTAMADEHGAGTGTEPVWAAGADALQLRLTRRPRGLSAHFVNATGSATPAQRALTALRRRAHDAYVALTGAPAQAQDASGAPAMVSRAEWGADQCRPRAAPTYGSVQAAFVHHTVNANSYGPQDSAAIVLAICRYHRDTNGWYDIGYNFLVDRFGTIFEGRAGGIDQAVIGAQAQGYNSVSTGVANIGTFSSAAPSAAALDATERLLAWKLSLHGVAAEGSVSLRSGGGATNRYPAGTAVTMSTISGHRDADRTTCPGTRLYNRLPEIRRATAQLIADLPPPPPAASITLVAADRSLAYPQPAQLSGVALAADGAALARAPVAIQVASKAGFVTLARTVSADDGRWSAQLASQYTRTVRALVQPAAGAPAVSTLLTIQVAPAIAVRAPARVVAGRPFAVSASIRPLRSRAVLVVARRGSDARFHTVARLEMHGAAGHVALTLALRRAALHRLRVETTGDPRNIAARSPDVLLRAVQARG
jgi:hypothetical protein